MAKLILMDFYADWCGPCKMQSPIFEALAKEYDGKVEFRKVNVDKEGDFAAEKGIMVVPTIILEKDGVEAARWMGVTSREELIKLYYDYSQGGGNGRIPEGRSISSFSPDSDWRSRPMPPRDKWGASATDAQLGLTA